MHRKWGCQRDNQKYTFLLGWLWWSALSLNYAACINLSWRMSGKVEWWYLISTDATQWEHQTGSEWVRWRLCNCWGRWLARLSPRLVSAVSNKLNQSKACLLLHAMVLSEVCISLTTFEKLLCICSLWSLRFLLYCIIYLHRVWTGAVPLRDWPVYTRWLALWWHVRLCGRLRWTRLSWVTASVTCAITQSLSLHKSTSCLYLLTQPPVLIPVCVYFNSWGIMWREPFSVFERWWVYPWRLGVRWWGGLWGWLRWAASMS